MILRTICIAWLVFEFLSILQWQDPSTQLIIKALDQMDSHDGSINRGFNDKILADYCNSTNETTVTACDNCACLSGQTELIFAFSTDCDVTAEVLEKIYELLLNASDIIANPPESRSRHGIFSVPGGGVCNLLNTSCMVEGLKETSHFFSDITSPRKPKYMDEACQELISKIETQIQYLITQIKLLVDIVLENDESLELRIIKLVSCVDCLRNNLNDTIQKALEEIKNCYENKFSEIFTCFATEINNRTAEIENLRNQVVDIRFNLIEAKVVANDYDGANQQYLGYDKNQTKLEGVFNNLLSKGYVQNVLQFGYKIFRSNITERAAMYNQTRNVLVTTPNDLWSWMVFHHSLQNDIVQYCENNQHYRVELCYEKHLPYIFGTLLRSSTEKFIEALDIWAASIRQKKYADLITRGSPETITFEGKLFQDAIHNITVKAYNKQAENLKGVLGFVSSLRWNYQIYFGFETLIEEANSVGPEQQLVIAVQMRQAMDNLNGPDGDVVKVREKFTELRNKLRKSIQYIVWGTNCKLRALGDNRKYLVPDDDPGFQAGNRRVKTADNADKNAIWDMQRVEVSEGLYEYRLYTDFYSEYLGQHIPAKWENWDNPGFEHLCTTVADKIEIRRSYYNWEIHFDDTSGSEIHLFHVGRRAYLYALPDSKALMYMYGKVSTNTKWELVCDFS